MSNFIFIERNIDVSGMLRQVLDNPQDWRAVENYENIGGDLHPPGFLPLIMAVVEEGGNPKNTELLQKTPMFNKYDMVLRYLFSKGISKIARAAFFKLALHGRVGRHIDDGTYYLTKDRFHLSLQGTYAYEVGDEYQIIEPGTFFWFDNKKPHSAYNISHDKERITFVFDSPHAATNPQHHVK